MRSGEAGTVSVLEPPIEEDLGDAALLEQTRAHSVFWGTAYEFGDEIPRMPARMERLPRDHAGRPVPWFVAWVDGKPDFRVIAAGRFAEAIKGGLCWVCGQRLGAYAAFLIGPMCAVNRTTAEPPCHRDCATWSAQLCPFLANPERRRRDSRLPSGVTDPSGEMIRRNPGVALVWVTRSWSLFNDGQGGLLIKIGDPTETGWYAHGREATRAEVCASIDSGLPILTEMAEAEGPEAVVQLAAQALAAHALLPAS